jgi:hypothetical protein
VGTRGKAASIVFSDTSGDAGTKGVLREMLNQAVDYDAQMVEELLDTTFPSGEELGEALLRAWNWLGCQEGTHDET